MDFMLARAFFYVTTAKGIWMDLMRYAADLAEQTGDGEKAPPVEKWNPTYCGEIDLTIRKDGVWIHEGTPIGRARLVRLLSTVIRKDPDGFYFVTPAEKLKFTVEDAPFLAVLMRAEGTGPANRLIFTTNVGEEITAGPQHQIEMRKKDANAPPQPYIHVRRGLDALIARSVFYDLVAMGETRSIDGRDFFGICSDGDFFPLADEELIV